MGLMDGGDTFRSGWEPGSFEVEADIEAETARVDALFDKATEEPETITADELEILRLADPTMFGMGELI